MRDIHGREAMPGDLIRIYHYRDRSTGRKCVMHKLLVLVDEKLNATPDGTYLYAVDVIDIWKKVNLQTASRCRLDSCGSFEIIDGPSHRVNGDLQTWYERPKVSQE